MQLAYEGDESQRSPSDLHAELTRFAKDHDVAIVAMSNGEGRPEVVIVDPGQRVTWFPADSRAETVYPIKGSFTERLSAAGDQSPFVPGDFKIGGAIGAVDGLADGIQYARTADGLPPPSGSYVVTSNEDSTVAELQALMERQGFRATPPESSPLWLKLVQDPLIIATVVFLGLGLLAAAIHWRLDAATRSTELVIRWNHGATATALRQQINRAGLPLLGLGICGGSLVCAVLVILVGSQGLSLSEVASVAAGAGIGLVLATLTWSVTTHVAVSSIVQGANRD